MNTCKPQKISLLDNTNCLLPNDIIPVVQKGTNRTISAKNLIDLIINRIKDILPGSSEAMCIAVEAKKLAELASADATLALKNLANALAYATKAYQLACLMDSRILALEGDHALIIELQDALALLTRQVNINTQRINDIINSNILKITTDADNNYTTYTFYVDNRKIGEIKVPKPKEYTGSQYIDINEERVISLTGLANVAFTGDYKDLSNRPTKLTDFYIDIDFLKDSDLEDIEDRITELEECCEELHRKPNKLISKLIEECDNPIVSLNGNVRSLTYDVFIDINTVNDTEYIIPDSETWNDIILPNSTHTITIIIPAPYFGKDLTLYNDGREIPMSSERIEPGVTLWSAKLTDIRGNVILTGKIFSSFDSSDIAIYDIDSGKKLYTSAVDIDLTPGLELLRSDGTDATVTPPKGYIFKENDLYILTLFPNTDWANIQYLGPTLASLEILEAPLFGRIYVSTLIEKEETLVVYHSVNLVSKGSGSGQIQGDNSIEDDQNYTAVIIPNSGSTITNVRVTDMENNDVPITSTLLGNNIQIEVPTVHSDICITVTFDLVNPTYYTVSLDQSISLATVSPTTILQNTGLNATVTPPTGYNVTITKATVNGNQVPMSVSGNLVAINGTYITGNVVLYGSLTKIPTSTTVTNKVANAHFTIGSTEYSTTATIPLNQSVVIQISPNTNYILDGDVKVTHGSLVLTANASNNYTVSIANVLNPITITGKTKQSSYTVTASKNFATAINTIEPNTVVAGSNNTIEISPKTNYILTKITDITEGGYSVINDSRVSYRKSGNNYIITFNNVLGNIVIDGTATKPTQDNQLFALFLDGGAIFGASHLLKDATVLFATAKSTAGYGSIRTQLNVSEYAGGQFPTKGPWLIEYEGARAYSIEDTASDGNRPTNWIDTITAPTISEISPTSGTGVLEITFTVPENNTSAKIFHEFTITQGAVTKSLYLYQLPSSKAAAWASKGFEFSPYSAGKTILLKFNNDWRIVQPTDNHLNYFSAILSDDYSKAGTLYEIADRNNTEDYTIMYHTDKLLSDDLTIEGTKNDTLTIICNTDVDPTWSSYNSTTAWWELPVFYINEGPKTGYAYTSAYPIRFKHDFNNVNESAISDSIISLVDHEYTGGTDDSNTKYYIKSVKVDNNIVYSGTATNKVTQSILGYRKGASIEVEIGDIHGQTVNIPNNKINVYYGAYKYQDSLLPATEGIYGDGIVWTQGLSLTAFDGKTVKFIADSGIIVPNNESSDNEKTWTYQIVIQQ